MSPLAQSIAALATVAAAAAWLLQRYLAKRAKPGCGGDCGCPASELKDQIRRHGDAGTHT
jgi:hypothetical protein